MNNREAGEYDPNIDNHPPICTCAECTKRRLAKKQSIWSKAENYFSFRRTEKLLSSSSEQTIVRRSKRTSPWLLAPVLIFSCSLVGLGITLFIGTAIPLYLLLGFSTIFSIENWYYLPLATRKHRYIGNLYRLLLNFIMLFLLGFIIWTSTKLFSQQYFNSQLVGSFILFAELVLFAWMWKVVSRNSWRWPSMKLTILVLLVVFIVLAFASVNPFSTYKDTIIDKISNLSSSLGDKVLPTSETNGESNVISNTDNEPNVVVENPLTGITSKGEYKI